MDTINHTLTPLSQTLYGRYIQERSQGQIIQTDAGFVVYAVDPSHIFIIEMYVLPEHRRSGRGKELLSKLVDIAVQMSIPFIRAGVYVEKGPNSSNTLIAALSAGFRVERANGGVQEIVFEVPLPPVRTLAQAEGSVVVNFHAETHGAVIEKWFEARRFPAPHPELLPKIGMVGCSESEPICAGFLYRTDGGLAIISHLISNPKASREAKDATLELLIQTLTQAAQNQGFAVVSAATDVPRLMGRLESLGFEKTDTQISHYRRILCQ